MLKVRLWGTKTDIAEALKSFKVNYKVTTTSKLYKDRGDSVYYRCYIELEIKK